MVFMAQKVKMCPPKYTKYKIDLTGQYTWKFENTPGQYGLIYQYSSNNFEIIHFCILYTLELILFG